MTAVNTFFVDQGIDPRDSKFESGKDFARQWMHTCELNLQFLI